MEQIQQIQQNYPKKFYNCLQEIHDYMEFNNMIQEKNRNIKEFENILIKYILLVKLAHNQINTDTSIQNKGLEIANYGLDCSDIIFSNLWNWALLSFDKNEIVKIVEKANSIDYLHKDCIAQYDII